MVKNSGNTSGESVLQALDLMQAPDLRLGLKTKCLACTPTLSAHGTKYSISVLSTIIKIS